MNIKYWLTIFIAACISSLMMSFLLFFTPPNSAGFTVSPKCNKEVNPVQFIKEKIIKPTEIKIIFFGDIMLDRRVKEVMNKNNGIDYLFSNFKMPEEWESVDVQMANLEGAVTENGAHYSPNMTYDFAFSADDINKLKQYGFNFFTIANNHMLDQGERGFNETQSNLDALEINYTGCPDKRVDGCSIKIVDVDGERIAMLGYSMVYGLLDEDEIIKQIEAVDKYTDLIIVNMHWGVEYAHKHNITQEKIAHRIIDAGADLIIGHHPHVAQDVEIYNNKIIFYSLGNFIFDQYFSRETQEGLAVGATYIANNLQIDLFPMYAEKSQAQLMSGEKKQKFLEWLAEISDVEEIKTGKINLL